MNGQKKLSPLKVQPNISICEEMAAFLREQLSCGAFSYALEFGTGTGGSTEVIAPYVKKLITVDNRQDCADFTANRLRHLGNVIYLVGYERVNIERLVPYRFDFVFIDGPFDIRKRYTAFQHWYPLIADNALIVLDDCRHKRGKAMLEHMAKDYGFQITVWEERARGIGVFRNVLGTEGRVVFIREEGGDKNE